MILEIKGNSLDDGPGIRSVVFFKGCPLSCVWCHNPESKQATIEISFDAKVCVGCGACRDACPEKALSEDNPYYIDRNRCNRCFACVDVCPSGALSRVGQPLSVDEVLAKILPDKPFYDTSGGGVTLSGGEPALYLDFSSKLLAALQQQGIHTLVETCGQFKRGPFMEKIYPYCDAIYFDIKLIDSDRHKKHCGLPNETILDNFVQLVRAVAADGKTLLPRTPLIPGITDTEANLKGIADFLKQQGAKAAQLLAYNPLWHEKSDKIGEVNSIKQDPAMTRFADKDVLARGRSIFKDAGIGTADYFENISYDSFDAVMKVNVYGTRNTISAILPYMKKNGGGHIVNLSSAAGLLGMFGYSLYSTTKYALVGFSECLRSELKLYNISVTVVCPPEVDTPFVAEEAKTLPPEARAVKSLAGLLKPEYVARTIVRAIKKKRFMVVPGWLTRWLYFSHRISNGHLTRIPADWIVKLVARKKAKT